MNTLRKHLTKFVLGCVPSLVLMLAALQVGNAAADEVSMVQLQDSNGTLTVKFPGINIVHTYVKQSDGVAGTATGLQVASQTYQNNQAVFASLPYGKYDLAVVKGAKTLIVDDVIINGNTVVENLVATLTVKFPGITRVHTYVKVDDGAIGTASGGDVDNSTYKNEETSLVVLKNTYDVVVVKNAKTKIIDAVDCTGGTCEVKDIVATLTVMFPGISIVHTYVKVDNGVNGTATGGDVDNRTYKDSETSLAVLRNTYDVVVVKNAKTKIIDAVDCTGGTCEVKDIVATLTVNFPGINGVHTYVKTNDGVTGFGGGDVDNRTYQNNGTSIVLLKGYYDVKVVKGAQGNVYDVVDCTVDTCSINNIVATLTVNFPGLSNVHTYIKTNDGVPNSATGGDVDNRTYQNNSTTIFLLKSHYDAVVKFGTETHIFDNVDCTTNTCTINLGNEPPVSDAGGLYSVAEGGSVQLNGSGADLELGPLTYAWDLDNSGSFETSGQYPMFSATGLDGPSSKTVVLRVTDNQGATATSSATVNINNVAPTIALSGTDFVSEGSPYSLTLGLITDPGVDSVSGYKINWGDGVSDTFLVSPSGVKTHTYPDGLENYTITVDLTDEDAIFMGAGTKALQITNIAPTIALSGTDVYHEDFVGEGSPYSLTLGPINDPGIDNITSYAINWGDLLSDIFEGSPNGQVKTHTYADGPKNCTITVDLTDEDGTFASAGSKAVTVNNVVPTIALSGDASVNEGSVYSLNLGAITDPGADTVSGYAINWGDLLSDIFEGSPTGEVNTHTYADGLNNYTITVDLTDEDGTFTGASSKAVAANNVAPANVNATATPGTINENDSTTLSGSFTDPGTLDTHTVVIAWGDGSTDTTLNLAANVLTFSTSHQYLDDNPTETSSDINSISVTVTDRDGGSNENTTIVTVNNVAPTATFSAQGPVDEGSQFTLSLTNPFDPSSTDTAAGFTYAFDCGVGAGYGAFGVSNTASCPTTDNGTRAVGGKIMDKDGGVSEYTANVAVNNVAPTASLGNNGPIEEGGSANVSFSGASDPSSDDTTAGLHYAFDCNGGSLAAATYAGSGTSDSTSCAFADNGSYPVSGKIMDKDGGSNEYTTTVKVNNVAPTLGVISVDQVLVPLNTYINASASFTDPGTLDTHTAAWDWGNVTTTGTVTQGAGFGSVSDSHSYSLPGVYTIKLTVTDNNGAFSNESVYQYVVVYDPSGGFVTGGGWIMSPAGAYTLDPKLTGKATFGFVAKYKKGANVPDGNTEFQFKVAGLNFKSASYDWLVVAGMKAQFKGVGTINGAGTYGFMLTATDGSPDTFRIKIWDKATGNIIYDNMLGVADGADPTTALGGGSIVIHK